MTINAEEAIKTYGEERWIDLKDLTPTEYNILSGLTNSWTRRDLRIYGGYSDKRIDTFFANRRAILDKLISQGNPMIRDMATRVLNELLMKE